MHIELLDISSSVFDIPGNAFTIRRTMAIIDNSNLVRYKFVLAGDIISINVSLIALCLICVFFWQRWQLAQAKNHTIATSLLLFSYATSFLFILVVTVLLHVRDEGLTLHSISKGSDFMFLIERVHTISWPVNPRHKTVEYIASVFCLIVPYAGVTALSIAYRTMEDTAEAVCLIGIKDHALYPLLVIEILSQLYLTLRFLAPLVILRMTGKGLLLPLQGLVRRTFIGTLIGFLSSLGVRVSFLLFDGEPAWLCCLACKIDALIASSVLHWITKPTNSDSERRQILGIGFLDSSATPPNFDLDREEIQYLRAIDRKNTLGCSIHGLGIDAPQAGSSERHDSAQVEVCTV